MRARFLTVCFALLAVPVAAQEVPRVEVQTSYGFARVFPGGGAPSFSLNGWNASLSLNPQPWLGLVADFSGGYAWPTFNLSGFVSSFRVKNRHHSYLFGPRYYYRKPERFTPFAHLLVGVVNSRAEIQSSQGSISGSDTTFSLAIGGGFDVKASRRIAIRVLQADYVLTRFGGQVQHNPRLSFGVVFRLGPLKPR